MYDESVPPAIGPRVPYPRLRETTPRVRARDLASYATQIIIDRGASPEHDHTIVPVDASGQPPAHTTTTTIPDPPYPDEAFACVSAWHSGGVPSSMMRNLRLHVALLDRALYLDPHARPAAVHAPDRSWAEQAVIVPDIAKGRALAREFAAPGFVIHLDRQLLVYGTGDPEVAHRSPTHRVVRPHTCPLLAAGGVGQLCQMHGGPWIARSIEAAAAWQQHRSLLLATLGCEVCDHGRFTKGPGPVPITEWTGGGPIPLVERTCASRWGGPVDLEG